jgi:hypothetical protein
MMRRTDHNLKNARKYSLLLILSATLKQEWHDSHSSVSVLVRRQMSHRTT